MSASPPPAALKLAEVQITERVWVVLKSDGFVDIVFEPEADDEPVVAEGLTADEARAASAALAQLAERLDRLTAIGKR